MSDKKKCEELNKKVDKEISKWPEYKRRFHEERKKERMRPFRKKKANNE